MNLGDLVSFRHRPDENTPGAHPWLVFSSSSNIPYSKYCGVVINKLRLDAWYEILWPGGNISCCYKSDIRVVKNEGW